MTETAPIEKILNPATGQWVRLPEPVTVPEADLDAFVAGYQQRLVHEWTEQQRAMSAAQLQAIAGRWAAASPGRWYVDLNRGATTFGQHYLVTDRRGEPGIGVVHLSGNRAQSNLRFVLNAHRDIAALIKEVERLQAAAPDGYPRYYYCERPGAPVEVVLEGSDRDQQIRAKERW